MKWTLNALVSSDGFSIWSHWALQCACFKWTALSSNEFITCFSRILNLRFFFTKFYVTFCLFLSRLTVILAFLFISIENFYLVKKTNQRKFREKIFRNRENIWWTWPRFSSGTATDLTTLQPWGSSVPGLYCVTVLKEGHPVFAFCKKLLRVNIFRQNLSFNELTSSTPNKYRQIFSIILSKWNVYIIFAICLYFAQLFRSKIERQ